MFKFTLALAATSVHGRIQARRNDDVVLAGGAQANGANNGGGIHGESAATNFAMNDLTRRIQDMAFGGQEELGGLASDNVNQLMTSEGGWGDIKLPEEGLGANLVDGIKMPDGIQLPNPVGEQKFDDMMKTMLGDLPPQMQKLAQEMMSPIKNLADKVGTKLSEDLKGMTEQQKEDLLAHPEKFLENNPQLEEIAKDFQTNMDLIDDDKVKEAFEQMVPMNPDGTPDLEQLMSTLQKSLGIDPKTVEKMQRGDLEAINEVLPGGVDNVVKLTGLSKDRLQEAIVGKNAEAKEEVTNKLMENMEEVLKKAGIDFQTLDGLMQNMMPKKTEEQKFTDELNADDGGPGQMNEKTAAEMEQEFKESNEAFVQEMNQ